MVALSASQERVLATLREGPLRADAIAAHLGIDPSAVRRHLDNLEALGLVAWDDVIDGPGRPKRFYKMTAAGRDTGPRNYPLLLAALMQKVSEGEGRKQLLRYLEAIASDLAGPPHKELNAKKRLDLLLAKYNGLGFDATLTQQHGTAVLIQRNCPFLAAATKDPDAMCRHLDEAIIRAAFPGATVELESALAKGDSFCRHIIRQAAATDANPRVKT